jgi:hypothetical protein
MYVSVSTLRHALPGSSGKSPVCMCVCVCMHSYMYVSVSTLRHALPGSSAKSPVACVYVCMYSFMYVIVSTFRHALPSSSGKSPVCMCVNIHVYAIMSQLCHMYVCKYSCVCDSESTLSHVCM